MAEEDRKEDVLVPYLCNKEVKKCINPNPEYSMNHLPHVNEIVRLQDINTKDDIASHLV